MVSEVRIDRYFYKDKYALLANNYYAIQVNILFLNNL